MIVASTIIGKIEKHTNKGQIRVYCHESRMNHSVKRLPKRCRMICKRLYLAKLGGTLVPAIIKMNSKKHKPIIV